MTESPNAFRDPGSYRWAPAGAGDEGAYLGWTFDVVDPARFEINPLRRGS